jgi:hypothetical protein
MTQQSVLTRYYVHGDQPGQPCRCEGRHKYRQQLIDALFLNVIPEKGPMNSNLEISGTLLVFWYTEKLFAFEA